MARDARDGAMAILEERHVLSILAFLADKGTSTKGDIYANVSRGTRMPDKLEALEREGLIEMTDMGANRALIELTEKGQKVGDIVIMLRDELLAEERRLGTST